MLVAQAEDSRRCAVVKAEDAPGRLLILSAAGARGVSGDTMHGRTYSSFSHDVRILESVPDRSHSSPSMLELALSLVDFAVGPPIPELPCYLL